MAEVSICYGMTETSPVSCQTRADDDLDRRTATIGRVHPHVEIKIVDPTTGETVERGEPGEFCTRGYSVMLGYWQDEEKTDEAIDADGWMHTGDLAEMREDGYCNIVGRIKDMVIRGGENIYPREIEEFLYTHPDIEDVQVIGVPDERYGEELAAWIKLRAGADPLDSRRCASSPRQARPLQDPALRAARRRVPDDGHRQDPQGADARGDHREARTVGRSRRTERGMSDDRHPGRGVLGALPGGRADPGAPARGLQRRRPFRGRHPGGGGPRDRSHARLRAASRGDRRVRPDRPAADHPGRADLRCHHARRHPETRLSEMAADPIFGLQVSMPILMGMLALPDAEVAEALVDKLRGLGRFYGELAERQREGVAAGRVPAAFAAADTVSQLDGLLVAADRRRPAAGDHTAAAGSRRRRLEGPAARGGRDRRTSRPAGLPRRAARRGAPARPAGRPVRPELAARRRRGVRRHAALLHDHRRSRRRRSTTSASRRSRSWRTSTAASAPRSSAPTTWRRSSRRCAANPGCTSAPATSW